MPASFARAIEGPGGSGVPLQSEQPDGAPRRPPRDRCRGLPLRAGRAARRGRVLPRICARRPRKERGRTRRVFAPCGRASAFTKPLEWQGLRLGYLISGNAQLIEGFAGQGRRGPSPRSPGCGHRHPGRTSNTSRSRDVLAGERAWLSHELSSLGLSVVPSDANFLLVHTPAKDIPERLHKQGFWSARDSFSVLSRFWCRVAVRTRKRRTPGLRWRSAARASGGRRIGRRRTRRTGRRFL